MLFRHFTLDACHHADADAPPTLLLSEQQPLHTICFRLGADTLLAPAVPAPHAAAPKSSSNDMVFKVAKILMEQAI